MGLSERQQILARLLTDADLRVRFCSDPAAAGQELALTPDDLAQLAALTVPDVERSARSLCAKRWNEIEKLLPFSLAAANQNGVPLRRGFMQFAQTWTPQGVRRHVQDALAFADWFVQQPAHTLTEDADAFPAWLPDLMRYEAAWLDIALDSRPRFVVVRRFRFPVHRIARALTHSPGQTAKTEIENVLTGDVLAVWIRFSPSAQLRHHAVRLKSVSEKDLASYHANITA